MKYITIQIAAKRWVVARKSIGGDGYTRVAECNDVFAANDIAKALNECTPPVEKVEPIADYKPRRRAA